MRAFQGQLSDNQPIKRSLAEKQKQLRDLKETLANMKSHTSAALRESVEKRIRELDMELRAAPASKAASDKNARPQNASQSPRRQPRRTFTA